MTVMQFSGFQDQRLAAFIKSTRVKARTGVRVSVRVRVRVRVSFSVRARFRFIVVFFLFFGNFFIVLVRPQNRAPHIYYVTAAIILQAALQSSVFSNSILQFCLCISLLSDPWDCIHRATESSAVPSG